MSGCADVCVYQDYDDIAEFSTARIVVARKAHTCCECRRQIERGESYERATGKGDFGFWSEPTCQTCVEIRKAFVCGSIFVLGMLWESVEEELFPRWRTQGPFECLAKLTTPEAREYCQQRFAEWEADRA